MTDKPADQTTIPDRSVRPVIEHALISYGYSPDTARTLIERLIAEGGDE